MKTTWIPAALLLTACSTQPAGTETPLPPASRPTSRPAAVAPNQFAQAVAKAYGFERWGEVEAIAFTFNVTRAEGKPVARRWRWQPRTNTVTSGSGEGAVTYRTDQVGESETAVDARFTNDRFWLLFPFHLVWDPVAVAHRWKQPLPIGGGEGERLVVTYPETGGYTPGDVYEVFLDDQRLLTHWVFRKGGGPKGRAFTWDDHRRVGPILLSLSHRDASKTLRVFFTDIEVETIAGKTYRATAKN